MFVLSAGPAFRSPLPYKIAKPTIAATPLVATKPKNESPPPARPRPEIDYQVLQRGHEIAGRFRIEEKLGSGGFAVAYDT